MRCCLLSLLLLIASLPASALGASAVLYGPDFDAVSAAAAASKELGTTDFVVAGSVAAAVGEQPVVAGASQTPCEGSAMPLAKVLVAGRLSVDDMEYAAAQARLREAGEQLPCGAESATTDELYNLFFLQGLAAFNAGDTAGAAAAFAEAVTLDPSRRWNDEFAPTAKETFLEALQRVVERPRSRLYVDRAATVDGRAVAAGEELDLFAGEHVVVVDGVAFAAEVADGADVRVLDGTALAQHLLAGDDRALPWLRQRGAEAGWTEVLVLGEQTHRFAGGAWVAAEPSGPKAPAPREPGTTRPPIVGIALGSAGAVVAGVGLGVHLDAYEAAGLSPVGEDAWRSTADRNDYPGLLQRNRAGLGLAIGGGVAMVSGVAVAIIQGLVEPATPVAAPLLVIDDDSVRVGIGGRF